jgi:hypothetical protein
MLMMMMIIIIITNSGIIYFSHVIVENTSWVFNMGASFLVRHLDGCMVWKFSLTTTTSVQGHSLLDIIYRVIHD